jgi:hypothetical protein
MVLTTKGPTSILGVKFGEIKNYPLTATTVFKMIICGKVDKVKILFLFYVCNYVICM